MRAHNLIRTGTTLQQASADAGEGLQPAVAALSGTTTPPRQPDRRKSITSSYYRLDVWRDNLSDFECLLLKGCQYVPRVLITDKLGRFAAAKCEILTQVDIGNTVG
jgi:hypothetical protein